MRRRLTSIGILSIFLFLTGCSGINFPVPKQNENVLPAITKTDTNRYYAGKFVWHDLITDDVASAKTFYAGLFAWSFKEQGDYTLVYNKGELIAGMMQVSPKEKKEADAVWLPLLSVKNVDKAVARVQQQKGQVLKGPLDMEKRGRGALVSDAQGAQLILLHAKGGDPLDKEAKTGDWLWDELWSKDPAKSEVFYRKLGMYATSEIQDGYRILKSKDKWRAGIRDVSMYSGNDVKTRWVPVVRVDNLALVTQKVKELGGIVLVPPSKAFHNGEVACISDNTGAILILQYWPDRATKGGK